MGDEERMAAIEMRIGSLEKAIEMLSKKVNMDEQVKDEPKVVQQITNDNNSNSITQSPLDDKTKWIHSVDRDTYEYLVKSQRCPIYGGERHLTCQNGYTIVKYKDIARVMRVRVKRYMCKTCKNTFLQPLHDMHSLHLITRRLGHKIQNEISETRLRGNNKLPRGTIKRIATNNGVDQKIVSSLINLNDNY